MSPNTTENVDLRVNVALSQNNSSPKTNLTLPSYLHETLAITITKFFILCVIALFGFAGNIVVVVVSTKRKAFKSSLDLYLKNLAIADLGFLLLIIPPGVLKAEIPFHWPLGENVCRYIYPMVEIFHGASVWTIVAVAIERYRNIVGLARVRRKGESRRSAMIAMVFVWAFSFIVFSVPEYLMIRYIETANNTICTIDPPDPDGKEIALQFYIIFLLVFGSYLLPLSVVIWTYVAISRQLMRSNAFLKGIKGDISHKNRKEPCKNKEPKRSNNDSLLFRETKKKRDEDLRISERDGRRLTQNKRAKKILTPVAITFAVSMLPINVMRIVIMYWREIVLQKYYRILFFITIIFVTANSSLNPLVYSIVSRDFRQALKSLFKKSLPRKKSTTSNSYLNCKAPAFVDPVTRPRSQTTSSMMTTNQSRLLRGKQLPASNDTKL